MRAAGISGFLGVGLGAFGAHGLRDVLLQRGMSDAWETAVRHHLLHAIGLLCLALWMQTNGALGSKFFRWASHAWITGTILFSGSLYGLALGGPHWLGPVTPLGGVALMIGWILLMVAASAKAK